MKMGAGGFKKVAQLKKVFFNIITYFFKKVKPGLSEPRPYSRRPRFGTSEHENFLIMRTQGVGTYGKIVAHIETAGLRQKIAYSGFGGKIGPALLKAAR